MWVDGEWGTACKVSPAPGSRTQNASAAKCPWSSRLRAASSFPPPAWPPGGRAPLPAAAGLCPPRQEPRAQLQLRMQPPAAGPGDSTLAHPHALRSPGLAGSWAEGLHARWWGGSPRLRRLTLPMMHPLPGVPGGSWVAFPTLADPVVCSWPWPPCRPAQGPPHPHLSQLHFLPHSPGVWVETPPRAPHYLQGLW